MTQGDLATYRLLATDQASDRVADIGGLDLLCVNTRVLYSGPDGFFSKIAESLIQKLAEPRHSGSHYPHRLHSFSFQNRYRSLTTTYPAASRSHVWEVIPSCFNTPYSIRCVPVFGSEFRNSTYRGMA